MGYDGDIDSDSESKYATWVQYVMEDLSPMYGPKVEGYTKVTPFKLVFMVKAKTVNNETSQKKKKANTKSKAPVNQLFDYPKFFSKHIVKEVKAYVCKRKIDV